MEFLFASFYSNRKGHLLFPLLKVLNFSSYLSLRTNLKKIEQSTQFMSLKGYDSAGPIPPKSKVNDDRNEIVLQIKELL